jgi:hypothetical protein
VEELRMRHRHLILILAALICPVMGNGAYHLPTEETVAVDEQFLRVAKIDTDGPGLLAFFRRLSLTDGQRERLESSIRQLGSVVFKKRASASDAIVSIGPPAVPFLRRAVQDHDLEVARRAQNCLEEIERQQGTAATLPPAAARLLAARRPAGAIEALLNYLPFNEDEWVEEEVLDAMRRLGLSQGKADPALIQALVSPVATRRSAAAFVVGRSNDPEQRAAVQKLLTDKDARVRLRAAQGLVAAHDKTAVPTLVALLGDAPVELTWKAEEFLYRVAGQQAPGVSLGDGSPQARQRYRDAWAAWWRDQGPHVDLGRVEEVQQHLGLTLLAEMDSNKVWEFGPDGKARWKLERLQGPMDAQMLPGGRVLVAEYQGQRVTERDLQNHIYWTKRLNSSPIACQRLANGNTFIATHNSLMEVTREGKEVYLRNPGQGLFIFGAQRLPNGHVACIANPGILQEVNAAGKAVKTIRLGNNFGGWCGVEALPGGRFLVALLNNGKVIELDASGKVVWECAVAGATHATRLPNGHTLVASMMNRRVVEVDREGKTVKETPTEGRPWKVHRR